MYRFSSSRLRGPKRRITLLMVERMVWLMVESFIVNETDLCRFGRGLSSLRNLRPNLIHIVQICSGAMREGGPAFLGVLSPDYRRRLNQFQFVFAGNPSLVIQSCLSNHIFLDVSHFIFCRRFHRATHQLSITHFATGSRSAPRELIRYERL